MAARTAHRDGCELRSDAREAGASLPELAVAIAVLGILLALALPFVAGYYRTAAIRAAAGVVAAFLQQGRQLAIQQNSAVCVRITPSTMRHAVGGCGGPPWIGPGTDALGNVAAPADVTLSASADPVFSALGAAAPAATYIVASGSDSLTVTVAASGRVSIR